MILLDDDHFVYAQEIEKTMMLKFEPKLKIVTNGIGISSSSNEISENESANINGKFVLDGIGVSTKTITLIETTNNLIIDETITNKSGNFSFTISPAFRDSPYQFVARYAEKDMILTSNTITISVLPNPPTLNISSQLVIEGYPATFYGSHVINDQPQDSQIQIVDKTSNKIIATTTTDSSGKYRVVWTPTYSNIPHEIYAVAPYQKINNISDFLTVRVHKASFTMETNITSVTENDAVIFSGGFLFDGKPVSGIPVTIFKNTGDDSLSSIGNTVTDISGSYSLAWNANFDEHPQVFFATVESDSIESISDISESKFQSNPVKVLVQKEKQPVVMLTLQKLPPTVIEGNTLNFIGTAKLSDGIKDSIVPISDIPVCVFDSTTNRLITSDTTDDDGEYNAQWKANYREKPYLFYASYFQDCDFSKVDLGQLGEVDPNQYFWTNTYKVKISEFPTLALRSIPEVTHGEIIELIGFTTENLAGQQVNVIIDNQKQFFSNLDDRGIFSMKLDSSQTSPGNYKVYLQCPCNGLNLISNPQIITINSAKPLSASIIPLSNVPISVTFNSNVTGGSPPYQLSWYVDRELRTRGDSFSIPIAKDDAYTVTLIAEDSSGQRTSDIVSVSINSVQENPNLDMIIETEGHLVEGEPITFRAKLELSDYPFVINQIIWKFEEEPPITTNSDTEELTKIFEENGIYKVVLTIVDENGLRLSESRELFIENSPPQILTSANEVMSYEGIVVLEARFTDSGIRDTFTIEWIKDETTIRTFQQKSTGIIQEEFEVGPGRHLIKLVVYDDDGARDSIEFGIKEYVLDDLEHTQESSEFPLWTIPVILSGVTASGIAMVKLSKKAKSNKESKQKHPTIEVDFRGGIKK